MALTTLPLPQLLHGRTNSSAWCQVVINVYEKWRNEVTKPIRIYLGGNCSSSCTFLPAPNPHKRPPFYIFSLFITLLPHGPYHPTSTPTCPYPLLSTPTPTIPTHPMSYYPCPPPPLLSTPYYPTITTHPLDYPWPQGSWAQRLQ